MPVAIEVGDRDGPGAIPYREGPLRLECSIAIAQQNGNFSVVSILNNDVQIAVAVHIGEGEDVGGPPCYIGRLWLKSPIAIPQQYGNSISDETRHDNVQFSVVVEITSSNACW